MSRWQGARVALVLALAGAGGVAVAQTQPALPGQPEPMVELNLQSADATQVAAELARITGEPVLPDGQVDGTLTLRAQVTKSTAVGEVARAGLLLPVRCLVLCPKGKYAPPAELAGDKRAKLDYTSETTLSAVAADLEKATERRVRCLPEVADLKVKATLAETDLRTVLDTLAMQADCSWTEGWLLSRPNPEQALGMLRMLGQLPDDQRNRMFDAGFGQVMNNYRSMQPGERQAVVQRLVGRIDGYAQALAGADPNTRAEVQRMLQPLVQRGMSVFVKFDAREQAELMPVVRALDKLR